MPRTLTLPAGCQVLHTVACATLPEDTQPLTPIQCQRPESHEIFHLFGWHRDGGRCLNPLQMYSRCTVQPPKLLPRYICEFVRELAAVTVGSACAQHEHGQCTNSNHGTDNSRTKSGEIAKHCKLPLLSDTFSSVVVNNYAYCGSGGASWGASK